MINISPEDGLQREISHTLSALHGAIVVSHLTRHIKSCRTRRINSSYIRRHVAYILQSAQLAIQNTSQPWIWLTVNCMRKFDSGKRLTTEKFGLSVCQTAKQTFANIMSDMMLHLICLVPIPIKLWWSSLFIFSPPYNVVCRVVSLVYRIPIGYYIIIQYRSRTVIYRESARA